jgi:molecular chaperone DnaJ
MATDPYTLLGVSKNASADEIKKAYRKLAHQHHPDKKGGNEAKFKEINEAYQTLSDPDKKARYDQFGDAGAGMGGGNPFGGGQYQDFNFGGGGGFESIFDMFSGGGRATRQRPEKGEDIYLEVQVGKKDLGQRKVYEFELFVPCETCEGTGVPPGTKRKQCEQCKGAGQVRQAVRTPFGTFAQVTTCPKCEGDGEIPEKHCPTCSGSGRIKSRRTLELHIPEKITDRYLVVFPQQGNAGPEGVPAGDLMITLKLK